MSGPIVLLLDRRGRPRTAPSPRPPERPGRLISDVEPAEPAGRPGASAARPPRPPRYTRAELAWIVIGGYWIALTLFVVPARSIDTPWALVGLLQFVAALGLWSWSRGGRGRGRPPTPGPTSRPSACSRPGRSPGSS